eukprot:9461424-Pyramimonas_sp.AAC.1
MATWRSRVAEARSSTLGTRPRDLRAASLATLGSRTQGARRCSDSSSRIIDPRMQDRSRLIPR